ncbi:hypothetical protein LZ30DRAFT_730247, partial [Colletotrichum cereale]
MTWPTSPAVGAASPHTNPGQSGSPVPQCLPFISPFTYTNLISVINKVSESIARTASIERYSAAHSC